MKIQEITIHNYRSIKEQKFHLKDFSLLVGENNAGKTNIISALRAFYEEGGFKYSDSKDFPKFKADDQESWIEIEYLLTDEETQSIKDEYKTPDGTLKVRRYFKAADKDMIDSKQSNIFAYENGALSKNLFYGAKNVSNAKLGSVIYIPEMTKPSDGLKLSGPSPLREITNFVFKKVVANSTSFTQLNASIESFNKEFEQETEGEEFTLNNLVKDINEQISHWEIDFGFRVNPLKPEDLVKNLLNHFIRDKNLDCCEIDIDNLGQGLQRHIIYTLIRLSAKYVDKKESKKKDFSPDFTLILFEEPEAFLHPLQQEQLNLSLKKLSKENQVLITTHSPIFVSKNTEDIPSLIKVLKNKGVTTIKQLSETDLKSIYDENLGLYHHFNTLLQDGSISDGLKKSIRSQHLGEDNPDIDRKTEEESFKYFLWLDAERSSSFFAKQIIICEGATEKVLFDYLMENRWEDLKKKQTYILDSLGKYNIHRYMNIFGRLGIPHSVLYDSDQNKEVQQILNDFVQNNKNDFTIAVDFFMHDLETELGVSLPKDKRLKPLNILIKASNGEIPEDKISALEARIAKMMI